MRRFLYVDDLAIANQECFEKIKDVSILRKFTKTEPDNDPSVCSSFPKLLYEKYIEDFIEFIYVL